MRIAIIGAGAIGGYYGGLLSEVADVTFIVRGATLEALRSRGLRIDDDRGSRVLAVQATDRPADVGIADVVIVTTKSRDLRAALAAALPLVGPQTIVMPVQNGVEAPYVVAEFVAEQAVVPCIVRGFLEHVAPAHVAYHGGPRSFTFNSWGNQPSATVQATASAIRTAGFEAVVAEDVWVELWEKAMFVVSFGALGALTEQPLGVLRSALREQLTETISEIAAVARVRGVPLTADAVARTLQFVDAMPEDATTSMQRDIMDGNASELDAQTGGIIRLARKSAVDTPRLDLMHAVLSLRPGQAL